MDWKRIAKSALFPPMYWLLVLLPMSIGVMIYGMLCLGEAHPITIASYALAFYTLVIWCVRIPELIRRFRTFKERNKYASRWRHDLRLRMNVTLAGHVLWNSAYGALQLGLGIYHCSAWFCFLAAYYGSLAVMRFFLVRHTLHHKPGEEQKEELRNYRTCGWVFLVMNLALSGMMFYMIHENHGTRHHEITTIAMAAYTFLSFTMAIVNLFRYGKNGSPVITASRAVSLAAACVSMLSLENTMLVTFGNGEMLSWTRQVFLALSGGVISVFIIMMAIYMIINANKNLKLMEN